MPLTLDLNPQPKAPRRNAPWGSVGVHLALLLWVIHARTPIFVAPSSGLAGVHGLGVDQRQRSRHDVMQHAAVLEFLDAGGHRRERVLRVAVAPEPVRDVAGAQQIGPDEDRMRPVPGLLARFASGQGQLSAAGSTLTGSGATRPSSMCRSCSSRSENFDNQYDCTPARCVGDAARSFS